MADAPDPNVDRRAVLAAAVGGAAVVLLGRSGRAAGPTTAPLPPGAIDAGPLDGYRPAQVYDGFRDQGFFVIHRDGRVWALSSICTHKGCKVHAQADQSYVCKCHGSRFDRDGHVTKGLASRDLPHLAVAETDQGHLLVDPARAVPRLGAG